MHTSDDNPTSRSIVSALAARALHPVALAGLGTRRARALLAALLVAAPLPGLAAAPSGDDPKTEVQSLQSIAAAAEATVRAVLSPAAGPSTGPIEQRVVARPPDPRLRLARCASEPQGSLPAGAASLRGRGVVKVSCAGPVRWNVLVPVAVETELEVLVARRNLLRGAVPGADDVEVRRMTLQGFPNGYVTNLETVAGAQLARPVATGTPLTREVLAAAPVVRRGESVTLVTAIGGLQVRAPGLALQDARPGERVRVQNVNSLKVVEGRADNQGMIEVDR